jgi:hypothetical protein
MIDAKLLRTYRATDAEAVPYTVYGVWIPRKGDNVQMTMEVVSNSNAIVTATLFYKNYEDTGNGSSAGVSTTFAAGVTGRQDMELLGSKELVRVQLSVTASEELSPGEMGWFLYRFLQPVWFEAVA